MSIQWGKYTINKRGFWYKNGKLMKWKRGEKYKLLYKKGKESIALHKAIAKEWLPGYFEGCIVHHLDGNPQNNHYANLYCCKDAKEHRQFHPGSRI